MSFPDPDTDGFAESAGAFEPFVADPFAGDSLASGPFGGDEPQPLVSPFDAPAASDTSGDGLAFSGDPFADDAPVDAAYPDADALAVPEAVEPDTMAPVRDARNEPVGLDRKVVLSGLLIAGTVVCLLLVVFGGGEPSTGSPEAAAPPTTPAGAYIDDGDAGYYAEAGLTPVAPGAGVPQDAQTGAAYDGSGYGSVYDAPYGGPVPASDYATTQAYPGYGGGSSGASSESAGAASGVPARPAESAFDKAVSSPLLAGRGARPEAPARRAVPDGLTAEQTQDLTFMREVADMFRPESGSPAPSAGAPGERASAAQAADRAPQGRPAAPRAPQGRATEYGVVRAGQNAVLALSAGSVIPAALVTGMNSELPGTVVAQTTRNVYDSATQRDVLIPAGTRLVGTYDDQIAYGQNRALVAWTQMIFPDGSSVELPGLPGADLQGNAGFADRVDRHYGRIVGSALLLATIGAGVELAAPNGGGFSQNPSPQEVASRQIALEVSRVATEVVRRTMDVQPTVRISPGYRFYVLLARDLPFDGPYRPRPAVRRFSRSGRSR